MDIGALSNRLCRFCRKPVKLLYPDAPEELQWGHISPEDAARCERPHNTWPIPTEGEFL